VERLIVSTATDLQPGPDAFQIPKPSTGDSFGAVNIAELEAMANASSREALRTALGPEHQPEPAPDVDTISLEDDDSVDSPLFAADEALKDAQSKAINIRTERMAYVESPIKIYEFVSKAGGAINMMRANEITAQDLETIAALRVRQKT
jgi:hypothetical protein